MRESNEPNKPHQNGVAERSNADIAAGATALLHTSNRTPASAVNADPPYYHWKGKKSDISYFRIFGYLVLS